MLENDISQSTAPAIVFHMEDVCAIGKSAFYPLLEKFGLAWIANMEVKVLAPVSVLEKLGDDYRIIMIYRGKPKLAEKIEEILEEKGVWVNEVIGFDNRKEFDKWIDSEEIQYYFSSTGLDIFEGMLRGVTTLKWNELA